MKYVIAKSKIALSVGISKKGHIVNNGFIIMNEKEIMNCEFLEGSIEERVQTLGGTIYTNTEINNIINEGGWNNGL